jgi:phospholipid/cholesterol/gamma-HCH transport system ATP-binding protein
VTNTDGQQPFIVVRGLEKAFGGKKVLCGVNLDVHLGETLVILGGSGSGKTVLLRHLNGLLRPDKGEVIVEGQSLNLLSEDELDEVRLKVTMVFQLGALFDSLSVYENVGYALREHSRLDEDAIRRRVSELLEMAELSGTEALYPSELSGGMRKRVALARALAVDPKAVLYDEPTTGLDPLVTYRINSLIRNLQKRLGFTSVVVTHDLKSAFIVGDRFALLDAGKIRFSGTAEEVRNTKDELMSQFVKTAL